MSFSKLFLAVAAFLALVGTPCFAADQPPMFTRENSRMTSDNKLKVYWMYDKNMDAVWFKVIATGITGYVGVGVSVSGASGMNRYDMAVGGVRDNGQTYLMDYLTETYASPPRDTTMNLNLYNATEEGGTTTLVYYRKRDTGDAAGDLVITPMMDLKWAYKTTGDAPESGSISKHDRQDTWAGVSLVPKPMDGGMMDKFTKDNMRSLDGGKFKYYWAVKDGMIWFKVMAKAKGWVAFGVTKEKSPTMRGFDVAVGGVGADGTNYLQDYYTTSRSQPNPDASQDYTLMMAEEKNDYTTLVFKRKLKTGDSQNDVDIKPGKMLVVWAYHTTSDVTNSGFGGQHTVRGYDEAPLVASSSLAVPSAVLVMCLAAVQFMFRF